MFQAQFITRVVVQGAVGLELNAQELMAVVVRVESQTLQSMEVMEHLTLAVVVAVVEHHQQGQTAVQAVQALLL
jgi:hypothetical protein